MVKMNMKNDGTIQNNNKNWKEFQLKNKSEYAQTIRDNKKEYANSIYYPLNNFAKMDKIYNICFMQIDKNAEQEIQAKIKTIEEIEKATIRNKHETIKNKMLEKINESKKEERQRKHKISQITKNETQKEIRQYIRAKGFEKLEREITLREKKKKYEYALNNFKDMFNDFFFKQETYKRNAKFNECLKNEIALKKAKRLLMKLKNQNRNKLKENSNRNQAYKEYLLSAGFEQRFKHECEKVKMRKIA